LALGSDGVNVFARSGIIDIVKITIEI